MSQSYDRISLWGFYQYDNNVLETLVLPNSFTEEEKQTIKDNIIISSAELELYYTDLNFFKFAVGAWSKKKCPSWDKMKLALDAEYNPLENYDRHESWTDSTEGSTDTSTTNSNTLAKTNSNNGSVVVDSDTTDNETLTGRNVVDGETHETKHEEGTTNSTTTGEDSTIQNSSGTNTPNQTVLNEVYGMNPNELWSNHDRSTTTGTNTDTSSTTGSSTTESTAEGSTELDSTNAITNDVVTTQNDTKTGTSSTDSTTTTTGSATENQTGSGTGRTQGTNESESTHEGRLHGNIGVTTSQQMLESEIELRNKYNIYDIIINDFIDEFCLRVY